MTDLIEVKQSFSSASSHIQDCIFTQKKSSVRAKTPGQRGYIQGLNNGDDLIFCSGPAGTGKTYLAVAKAVEALEKNHAKKIILMRPAVEAGEKLGFLPGSPEEKVDPYLRPLFDALHEFMDAKIVKSHISNNTIEICPVAFLRGRTLKDSFIVVDEAQNCTFGTLTMITSRLGHGSRMVIVGDPNPSQVDLLPPQESGFQHFINAMSLDSRGIGIHYLSNDDVIRHPIISVVLKNIKNYRANGDSAPRLEQ